MTASHLLTLAEREHWALGAFNAANLETLQAIFQAASALAAPVLIESSPGETAFVGETALRALVDAYRERYGVHAYLNLDHAETLEQAERGLGAGYDLIHLDASEQPYAENVRVTRSIVEAAHRQHRLVEGELEHIPGSSSRHAALPATAQRQTTHTDPDRAESYVRATNVDTLAVSIGNVHGVYAQPPTLNFERLHAIRSAVRCHLSLHGGSGIRDADIRQAIQLGIAKINVNSELRLAYLEALQRAVKKPKEVAVYKFMPPVIAAVQRVVEAKLTLFGSAGKAKRTWVKRMIG
ncbi:class II fructose-bisphosphate aldolase [Candidatus Berkelbacteria bacterium]|nr:class II fructose-bisphosphate aldolase [Candidatus Berkelbacteria bacterium]